MSPALIALALALQSAAPTAEAQTPAPPGSPYVPSPDDAPRWLTRPSGADVAAVYPMGAARARKGGRAVIKCIVATTGYLRDCSIVSETPEGLGFGQAALRLGSHFRMKPKSISGRPVEGASVTIPIVFSIR